MSKLLSAGGQVDLDTGGDNMNESSYDIYDDLFWKSFEGRMERTQGFRDAMDRLESLAWTLSTQAHQDCVRRLDAESPADRERRFEREQRLRELILGANSTDDPDEAATLWLQVDEIVFGWGEMA